MKTKLMGILNVTPDSFYDGGKYPTAGLAAARARELAAEGADIIDIGGESSRPNSEPVSARQELARVLPVLKLLAKSGIKVSLDTYKPEVAKAGLELGVSMINDITGLANHKMRALVAAAGCKCVIMHMKGMPRTMQHAPKYKDVAKEVADFFKERVALCESSGIARKNLILDPGIGFGKLPEHNLLLLQAIPQFRKLGPVLIGASRKSFMGKLFGAEQRCSVPDFAQLRKSPKARMDVSDKGDGAEGGDRLYTSLAVACYCYSQGVDWLRVHDVKESRLALKAMEMLSK